jgi:tetratricopeptide (TPR) repeat protein
VTFAEMLDERVRALPREGQRFLEALAICGRPMVPEIVCDACGVTRERQSLVAMLRSAHFIRSSGSSERVETYHDRIREAVAAQLAPGAVRQIHALVAQTLVDRGGDDCEALFEHYRGAGDDERASIQAGRAAAKACTALAFDRAAFFYREALALRPASPAAAAWREAVAEALANAGQPSEAAESYLRAAGGAAHPHQIELQRRAAEQFLIAGDIDRGLDLIRAVLAALRMRMPRSRGAALARLIWRRARLRWRGLRFVPKPAAAIDSDTLLRIDTCWSAATGLAMVDVIGASEFNIRDLQMALDAGDSYRIARAMAIESATRSVSARSRASGERLARESKALAQRIGNPHAIALSSLADAMTAMMSGRFSNASTFAEQAAVILRDQCVGVTWELNSAQNLGLWALMYQGELAEASRRFPVLLAGARRSGNWFVATELCTRSTYVWLAADQPDEGERVAIESIAQWSHQGVHRQHYSAVLTRIQMALYRGDAAGAWRLLGDLGSILRQTYLRHVQLMQIESCYLRARSALAMAAVNRSSGRFVSVARAEARRIAGERMPWSDPIALVVQAGVAFLEGRAPLALRHLHDAAGRFERADMRLHAAAARSRIGTLQDDAAGRDLRRQAEEWMAMQQIKNPAGMTRMLTPGFPDVMETAP